MTEECKITPAQLAALTKTSGVDSALPTTTQLRVATAADGIRFSQEAANSRGPIVVTQGNSLWLLNEGDSQFAAYRDSLAQSGQITTAAAEIKLHGDKVLDGYKAAAPVVTPPKVPCLVVKPGRAISDNWKEPNGGNGGGGGGGGGGGLR